MAPQDPTSRREQGTAVVLFLITLATVFFVYGTQHAGGNPLADPEVAADSARFAFGLMSILLAHEMAHYLVARRHGFALSLPYFLPLPFAFGTFGAIIRLRSMPRSRTALLEMGAAGPLAGFAVALVVLALGIPHVTPMDAPVVTVPDVVSAPDGVLLQVLLVLDRVLGVLLSPLEALFPAPKPGIELMGILANPPAMDALGLAVSGRIPGRYDLLDPLTMAGWVGCLLTGINLLPIGQLDGGHIMNALAPRAAPWVAKAVLGLVFIGGMVWPGWAVWGFVLLVLRAWISLPVPSEPAPTPRAKGVAVFAGLAFLSSFMPRPFELEELPRERIHYVHEDGSPLRPEELEELWGHLDGGADGVPAATPDAPAP